ncbi:MAG: hypothetical protein M1118_06550 [Chloroflexi bacterium]|nr:hypothetical protein [Chloroflexota bacterium]
MGSAQLVAVVDPNSRVSSVESLDSWVTYLEHEGGTLWQRMALDAFTSVRSQTAIDPESGAARDNTLRSTRVLRRHLRFQAPVTLSDDEGDGDRSERTLALAAAALQRLGTSRNRGFGRAKAGLWKGRENLTERQLRWLDGVARRGVAR